MYWDNKFNRYWISDSVTRSRQGRLPRLWLVILKIVWWRILLSGFLLSSQTALQVLQSIILGTLTNYFVYENPTSEQTTTAYLYATGLVMIPLIGMFLGAHGNLQCAKAGTDARIVVMCAIYRKILRMSQGTLGEQSFGRIMNLASNDVQRFEAGFGRTHYLWITPLYLVAFTILVYQLVGWSVFFGIGVLLALIPVQFCVAQFYTRFSLKAARLTDQRVKIMSQVIEGIRVIKMYAWEYAYGKVVADIRSKELHRVFQFMSLLLVVGMMWLSAQAAILFAIFLPFTATGGNLDPEIVFTTVALVNLVIMQLQNAIFSMISVAGLIVGNIRIQAFLDLKELPQATAGRYLCFEATEDDAALVGHKRKQSPESMPLFSLSPGPYQMSSILGKESQEQPFVRVRDLSASWSNSRERLVLENINFELNEDNNFMAIVGPVGAGKSSLLQSLIGELRPIVGSVEAYGKLSYASQMPWIFSETVRENVIFGLPFHNDWYNVVIKACALDKDIEQLSNGDQTLVGERGAALSGGQKARVNLARAIYREADIYFLDAPLAAVDAPVAKHIFEKVIRGLLRDKIIVLVTHQLQYAECASTILVIEEGHVKAYSSYRELQSKGIDLAKLTEGPKGVDKPEDKFVVRGEEEEEEDEGITEWERRYSTASVSSYSTSPATPGTAFMTPLKTLSVTEIETTYVDPMSSVEGKAEGTISMATYFHYLGAAGNSAMLLGVLSLFVLLELSIVLSTLWVSDWADCTTTQDSAFSLILDTFTCDLSKAERLYIYAGIVGIILVFVVLRAMTYTYLCIRASAVLHKKMFASVIRAPMHFFDVNSIGRVLNRFSKDIGGVDLGLPLQLFCYIDTCMGVLASLFIAITANFVLVIPATILVIILLIMRWYFLQNALSLRRLDAVARSPLFSHYSTTLQGLSTIRTFREESLTTRRFLQYQNDLTQVTYLSAVLSQWFAMRLEILGVLFLASVSFLALSMASYLDPALIGLSLSSALTMAIELQAIIALNTSLENLMVSVERILEYTQIEPEAPLETFPPSRKPPPEWPDKGEIVLDDVSLRYANNLPLTLNSISLTVRASEKVGIVGRTGAGKSSLLAILFRMVEPEGAVIIDGVNTLAIGLHDLRKKISIIPQDPVLFSGTLRYNLDPFEEYSDKQIWDALEQVQLKDYIQDSEQGGLDGEVSEGGSNFSVGQRQLVCLARALLRRNKILVLDEATANVDLKTDSVIQEVIRRNFADCTVLTIAHRLNTIMDSDRVLVVDKGELKEFDNPYALLQRRTMFKGMVEQTGPSAADKLFQMAKEAHTMRKRAI